MCSLTALSVSYIIRVGVFAAFLALLPSSVVPLSVYFAFVLTLVVFVAASKFPSVFDCLSWGLSLEWPAPSSLVYECAIGLLLAAIVGAVGFGAIFVARYVQQMVLGFQVGERNDPLWRSVYLAHRDSLQTLVLLIFLYLVFSGPGQSFAAVIYSLLQLSYLSVPPLVDLPASWWGAAVHVVIGVGYEALTFVALVGIPLFFASLFVDLIFILVTLIASEYGRPNAVASLKMPVLLLFMAVAVYPFAQYTGHVLAETFEPSRVEDLKHPQNFPSKVMPSGGQVK